MDTIKLSKNLWLHEYVPENLYKEYANKGKLSNLVYMLDERLILADQFIRDRFGSIVINNWYDGGNRQHSGIRLPESPYYTKGSQHSFGRASDKLTKISVEEIRKDIKKNVSLYYNNFIFGVEDEVSWLHTDCRNTKVVLGDKKEVLFFKP